MGASTQEIKSSDFQWDRESFNSETNVLNRAPIGSVWIMCLSLNNLCGIRERLLKATWVITGIGGIENVKLKHNKHPVYKGIFSSIF